MADRTRGYAHRIDVEVEVPVVWQALTDPAMLSAWCAPRAQIRPAQGGHLRLCLDRVTELEAHIDVFEPARRLRLIYLPGPALPPADSAHVDDFILEPGSRGTIVRLLGSGIPRAPEWDMHYLRLRTGWHLALNRLKALLEGSPRREGPP